MERLVPRGFMLVTTVAFLTSLLAALTAGAMFGVWLGRNPRGLAVDAYIAQQQHLIRAMNVAMPALGAATTVMTLVDAAIVRDDRMRLALLLASAACFAAAGLVTRLCNQPINTIVMTWSVDAVPPVWEQLRDRWWRWHTARTASGIAGLCLSIAASLAAAGHV